ncbi:MAG: hypothetical protein CL685_02720 [Candidatus Magasanikbacteria bacterium]|nr:hypothetical protein [Candidatus Magasanikbacteria bacterium]
MLPWIQQYMYMNKKTIAIVMFSIAVVFLFVFTPSPTFAQNDPAPDVFGVTDFDESGTVLVSTDIRVIIMRIINVLLGLLGIAMLGIVIYGGAQIMFSGGAEDKIVNGKKIIVNGVIGLAITLSAFTIAQFVLNKLSAATGTGRTQTGLRGPTPPEELTFTASGALGRVIKDHYPNRGQTDVARNTSISITFTEAVDPASIILNTNNSCEKDNGEEGLDGEDFIPQDLNVPNNGCKKIVVVEDGENIQKDKPFYGGCLGNGAEAVCDTVNTATIRIQKADDEEGPQFNEAGDLIENPRLPAIVYASYEGANREVKTFRIKPIENLGSPEEHVWHKVEVWGTGTEDGVEFGVKTARDTNAFGADPDNHYMWEFETGTNIDTTPPTVVSVYPAVGRSIPRNDTVSITFSEPVDPMEVQGTLSQDSSFHNMIFGNADVSGEWKISNGYKTVEFYSDQACGKNTCGDTVYCLPVADIAAEYEDYEILVRTATPQQNAAAFAGISPGVMDMAGNMLDGGDDGVNDGKPVVGDKKVVGENERDPDNYHWEFEVRNEIDLQPPYIKTVTPLVDAQDVGERAALKVTFSKVMQLQTLYDVGIEEYGGAEVNLASIWKRPTFERSCDQNNPSNCHTEMTVQHRVFGPQGKDLYYAITTTSTMKSSTGNCFYPGFGPENQNSDCAVTYSQEFPYLVESVTDCIPTEEAVAINAPNSANNDTGCAYTINLQNNENMQPDRDTCVEHLQDPGISPPSGQPGQ